MPEKNISDRNKALAIIKDELRKNSFQLNKVLLFGSRAKGTARKDSDWDLLVLIEDELTPSQRISLVSKIRYRLATELIDADIIVKSVKDYDMQKDNVGYLSYYAEKEGITL